MTVGSQVRDMVEDMMLSAFITSPRFEDYTIDAVEIPNIGAENIINDEVRTMVEKYARLQKRETQYDSHVKLYGRFKRAEDKDTVKELTNQLQEIKSVATNPQAFLMTNMIGLIPQLAPLIIAAQIPQIIEAVIEMLTRPGMPLDPRFTRFMEKEWNTGLDRQKQFNTMIGRRNVVVQTAAGWRNSLGAGHTSVNKRVAEGTGAGPRLGTIVGMPDKSIGAGGRQS